MHILKKKLRNNFGKILGLLLVLLILPTVACNTQLQGTYAATKKITVSSVDVTLDVALALGETKFTLKINEYTTETYSGKYEIDEYGKITFDANDASFPFEKSAEYNAAKKTITIKHKFYNQSIVLKKR